MSDLSLLIEQARSGPWRWDPENVDSSDECIWLTNADGDQLVVTGREVADLLNQVITAVSVRDDVMFGIAAINDPDVLGPEGKRRLWSADAALDVGDR